MTSAKRSAKTERESPDLAREGVERPRVGGAPVHQSQRGADVPIAQRREPAGRFGRHAVDVLTHRLQEHELAQFREDRLAAGARTLFLLQRHADQVVR